jgi:5-aminolevulinate synthase
MDYEGHFAAAVDALKNERRYRTFAEIERDSQRFPPRHLAFAAGAARDRHLVLERLSRHGLP